MPNNEPTPLQADAGVLIDVLRNKNAELSYTNAQLEAIVHQQQAQIEKLTTPEVTTEAS